MLNSGQGFLDAIDKEHKSVTVIVHISEDNIPACRTMNVCLSQLSKLYENVKFCSIAGSTAGISRQFKAGGIPALLVYKAGNLVGNFVQIAGELGTEFEVEDVQGFLIEHGLLEDKSCKPLIIRSAQQDTDDSDE